MLNTQQMNIVVPAGKKGYAFVQKLVEDSTYPAPGCIDSDHLKKFYKHLEMDQLLEWVRALGVTYNRNDNPSIDRMRACMAIYNAHFPKPPSEGKKSKSKYGDYTDEQLLNMAIEHEVVFEPCDDPRILRMRAIMALRAHKILS